jgi:hypothetical protein
MITESLTAADFARSAGHYGTSAMEADILVAAPVVDLTDLRARITAASREVATADNAVEAAKLALATATKRGQMAAIDRHTGALTTATTRLEAAKAARADLEARYDAAGGEDW